MRQVTDVGEITFVLRRLTFRWLRPMTGMLSILLYTTEAYSSRKLLSIVTS